MTTPRDPLPVFPAHDDGIRIMPCPECGGDGGWSYPVSHDPFRKTIREATMECRTCGGTGEAEIEFYPVELEDLEYLEPAS